MATYQKRQTASGKVRWRAIVRVAGAASQSRTFGSRRAAERWAAQLEDDIKSGGADEAFEAKRRTVRDACRRWIRDRSRDPDLTVPRGRRSLLAWWSQHLGPLTLASLTPAKIRAEATKLTCSGPTKNRYLAALSAVLESARRDWGWMRGENPVHLVRKWPEHPGRVRVLSDDEMRRLLAACKSCDPSGRIHDWFVLAVTTGARQGEIGALRLKDLYDLDGDEPYALVEAREAGARKTGERRRLELVGPAVEVVKDRASARRSWARERNHPDPESVYLFGTAYRGKPWFQHAEWKKALQQAKIEDFRFHDSRHCAASYFAVNGGASLRDLMDMLGHRTAAMSKRYSHLVRSHTRRIASKAIAERLAGVHEGDSPESQET